MLLGKKAPLIADITNRGVILLDDVPYEFQTASICENDKLNDYVKQVISALNEQIKTRATRVPVLPEKVTLSDVRQALQDLTTIPVGIEKETLDIATYNFKKNLISLINSEDITALAKLTSLIIKETTSLVNVETMVLDLKDFYDENTFENVIYHNLTVDSFKFLNDEVFREDRTNNLIVFITGVEKLIGSLDPTTKNSLITIFTKMSELKNVSIVFVGRVVDIKTFAYEPWFKQFASSDGGIYVGRGINNNTLYSISTSFRILNEQIPPNFGYVVDNGIATRIKVLEGDE